MANRTFGLMTGYGITGDFRGQGKQSPDEMAREAFRAVAEGRSSDGQLRNGARLNLQAAGGPQYTTPDCDSLLDLIAHDKAGERILEELGADAETRLRDAGTEADIRLYKTSRPEAGADPAGRSAGCLESYLVGRHGEFGSLADALIPFLVTRQLICGAGTVLQTQEGAVYTLSPEPGRTAAGTSPAWIRSRPVITTRDEPQAAASGFRRLHVAVSEPNMSETTVLLKLGATDLVLRIFEAGTQLPELILDHPVTAVGDLSRDLTGRTPVRLADGRKTSAVDIQREYLTVAKAFTERNGAATADRCVLGLWERVLDSVETGRLDAIAREIDWVAKYQLIERHRAAHGLSLSAPQIAELDRAYHDVNRGRGGYYLLQHAGAVERAVRDIDIFEAKTVPPSPGRWRQAG